MADENGTQTYTEDQVNALVEEKLAAAKAEGDTAFKTLWAEAKAAKKLLKELGDPDEIKTLKQRFAELEQQKKAEKAGITAAELERIRRDVEKDYSPWKAEADAAKAEIRTLRLDGAVKKVMAESGVRPERIESLFRLAADEFDLTDDGKPMLKNHMGADVGRYVKEDLFSQYPEFYMGTGSSGGGATKSNAGSGGSARQISKDDFTKGDNLQKIARGEVKVTGY